MLLRRRKMEAMMYFGILIINYKYPNVMNLRDILKRFMMSTCWFILKKQAYLDM